MKFFTKKTIKAFILGLFILPGIVLAQLTVPQGGTGLDSFSQGSVPFMDTGSLRLATSSAFQFTNSNSNLTVTNASTTAFSVSDLVSCDTIDTDANGLMSCGTDEGGTGGSALHEDGGGYVYPQTGDYHSAPKYVATSTTAASTFVDVTISDELNVNSESFTDLTGIGLLNSASSLILDQTFTPTWSGLHTFTATGTFNGISWDYATSSAINLTLERIGNSTYSTVQQLQDVFHSSGVVTGGTLTDDTDGTITVSLGNGFIRPTNSAVATLFYFDWATESGANVALTDTSMNYIYVEYNSDSPQVIATITKRTDEHTNVLLGTVYRDGTDLHITEATRAMVGDHALNMLIRMRETMPFQRVSGGVISELGTRNLAVTSGDWWEGLTNFTTAAIDSSVASTFTRCYSDGVGGFTTEAAQTQWNNTQYDDGTGTLATLSNSKYGVHWLYLAQDGDLFVLYGGIDGSLTEANDAGVPSNTPPQFDENHAKLIGKIVFQKSASTVTSIQSAFNGQFSLEAATDHGGLTGLGDDDHTQYLLADGTRALAGAWNMASFALTNVNIDSGVITGITDLAIADGGTGLSAVGTGVDTWWGTPSSVNLASAITDETGTGAAVFGTSPTIAGLTGTGVWDLGGGTSFEIPNGTNPATTVLGQIALDTTDDQLIVDNGTEDMVYRGEDVIFKTTIASTSVEFVSGGVIPLPPEKDGFVLTQYRCHVVSGTSVVINLSDGTNDTETITCATTLTSDTDVATNDTFTAGELAEIQFGTVTGVVDYLSFTAYGHWTRE